MLFGETVAVYCENHTEHINTLCEHFSSYLTGNTLRLRYEAQPVNAVSGNSHCLLWEPYGTYEYTVWVEFRVFNVEACDTYIYIFMYICVNDIREKNRQNKKRQHSTRTRAFKRKYSSWDFINVVVPCPIRAHCASQHVTVQPFRIPVAYHLIQSARSRTRRNEHGLISGALWVRKWNYIRKLTSLHSSTPDNVSW
jgi:hypothetical protein